ncbi:MAG: DUF3465 domain-containing protein [Pseudomonadales bacterium]|jgi:hypothetical protein|nr:DUF3465 domain-containing protein [Pseudomonadales bacterium]
MRKLLLAGVVLLAAALGGLEQFAAPGPANALADGDAIITAAFRDRREDLQVRADGIVAQVLADDRDGSRHQRFILRLASGHTVLVAHNIDLAPRIDGLRTGDRVAFNGVYEWNPRGGVVHWTHHDPQGRHEAGWLEHEGRRYQ